MRYGLIAVFLAVSLSGCVVWDAQDDFRLSRYAGQCEKIGHVPGTPEFRNCQTHLMGKR